MGCGNSKSVVETQAQPSPANPPFNPPSQKPQTPSQPPHVVQSNSRSEPDENTQQHLYRPRSTPQIPEFSTPQPMVPTGASQIDRDAGLARTVSRHHDIASQSHSSPSAGANPPPRGTSSRSRPGTENTTQMRGVVLPPAGHHSTTSPPPSDGEDQAAIPYSNRPTAASQDALQLSSGGLEKGQRPTSRSSAHPMHTVTFQSSSSENEHKARRVHARPSAENRPPYPPPPLPQATSSDGIDITIGSKRSPLPTPGPLAAPEQAADPAGTPTNAPQLPMGSTERSPLAGTACLDRTVSPTQEPSTPPESWDERLDSASAPSRRESRGEGESEAPIVAPSSPLINSHRNAEAAMALEVDTNSQKRSQIGDHATQVWTDATATTTTAPAEQSPRPQATHHSQDELSLPEIPLSRGADSAVSSTSVLVAPLLSPENDTAGYSFFISPSEAQASSSTNHPGLTNLGTSTREQRGDHLPIPGRSDLDHCSEADILQNTSSSSASRSQYTAPTSVNASSTNIADPVFDVLDLTGKLNLREKINGGGFCAVYKAERDDKTTVAVKVLNTPPSDLKQDPPEVRRAKRLRRELAIWKSLDHPRILRLIGRAEVNGNPAFISPFYPRGNAKQYLAASPDGDREKIISGLVEAVIFLHSRMPIPIVHGDLKPVNILIENDGSAILCDFGTTAQMGQPRTEWQTAKEPAKTIAYAAPEIFNNELPTTFSDVYSIAWAIIELLTDRTPYYWAICDPALLKLILSSEMPTAEQYPNISGKSYLWQLFKACLNKEPKQRPTITAVQGKLGRLSADLQQAVVALKRQPPCKA